MQLLIIIFLVFALMISVFAVQNPIPVNLKFFVWSFSGISLVLIILGSFLSGALLAILLNTFKNLKNKMHIKELISKVQVLTEEKQRLEKEISSIETNNEAKIEAEESKSNMQHPRF